MELDYVLTLEDYVAFSVDQSRNIPAYHKQAVIFRLTGFLLLAVFGAWKAVWAPGGTIFTLIPFFIVGFLWVLLYDRLVRWRIRRYYMAYFSKPGHTQRLGKRHMILKDREMTLETDAGRETIDLSGITRLTSDKFRYFLYFGDNGMPVPYSAFPSAKEARVFLGLIRSGSDSLAD